MNQLVLTFEFALETFDPINFTSFNTQLKSISLSELESKTVDRSLNLIEYLCHIPAYFECTTFSRCLFALMDSITQKFYQQESEVGFDFFESSGVISVDLIFDLLKQKNVKTALQLLEIYQALFSRFPDLKRLFTDRVLLKLHDSSELDLINQYGFWDLPRLHFFMNKLLEITFPGSRILFDKKIFLPSQQVHFKMYLLFEFYVTIHHNPSLLGGLL